MTTTTITDRWTVDDARRIAFAYLDAWKRVRSIVKAAWFGFVVPGFLTEDPRNKVAQIEDGRLQLGGHYDSSGAFHVDYVTLVDPAARGGVLT